MLRFRILFTIMLALAFLGCASPTKQTDDLLSKTPSVPESYRVEGVPFINQSKYYCGPATLAMAMNWAGKSITVDEVAHQVYTPEMKGSLQVDMMTAARRQGLLAVPIEGLEALLKEVAAGHPVIVFENLSVSWLPQWHYSIVHGYDIPKQIVIMHSGPEANKFWDLRKFERSWMLGDYWGLVVLPPGQLSATADELTHIKAAVALEKMEKGSEAEATYRQILVRWPQSLAASIGAANVAFAKNDLQKAEEVLRKATVNHPQSSIVWHNLAVAEGALNKKIKARQSALQALRLVAPEEKSAYQENLKEWVQ